MDEKLKQLKRQYMDVPIPQELTFIVDQAIKQRKKRKMNVKWLAGICAAAAILFITGVNASPTFANALSEVPLLGNLVQVITFREYKIDEKSFKADFKIPAVRNMENKALENALNDKYIEENKKLYNEFIAEMESMKKNGGGHAGVDSGYEVKTDNDRILSLGRYVVNTVGSSSTTFKYDTIDKKNQVLLTLPSLFKDDRYIGIISENIRKQMKEQMMDDPEKAYWVAGIPNGVNEYFETISKDQNFYISNDGKLVISFNKYEVAPGYMGIVEFMIPTEVLSDKLIGNEYIK